MYKLLIVDDEQLERRVLRQIIRKELSTIEIVGEAKNGDEAVELAKELMPDIILMDIKMPGKSGLEASEEIRHFLPQTKIIILTAFDYFDFAQSAIKLGASEYLLKPVRPKKLLTVLEKLLVDIRIEKERSEENKKIRDQLGKIWPYIQTSFIYNLIDGNISSERELKEQANILGLNLEPAGVIIVNIDKYLRTNPKITELDRQLIKQKVYTIISEAFSDNVSVIITPFVDDKIIVLIEKKLLDNEYLKTYSRKKAEEILHKIEKELKKDITVTIGIGNFYNDVSRIRQSYLEALRAQRKASFLEKNKPLQFSDMDSIEQYNYNYNYNYNYPFSEEEKLLEKIRLGDTIAAKEILDKLWEDISKCNFGEELQKACALELLVVFYRAAIAGGANLQQMALLNLNYLEELSSCKTSRELASWLSTLVERFIEYTQKGRISSTQTYININYQKDLKLEEVAKQVHLSPYYLSRVFKQEEGITLKQYIIKLRIEQAKKLLLTTQKAVIDIASQVGYQDPSYFCRIFKQTEGFSPKEFRAKKS